jgi:hypothetical protein
MAAGEKVSITTAEETLHGTLLPEDKDFVILKLDSGYNIGINKKRVKEIKTLEKHHATVSAPKQVVQRKDLPKITILHTGGTIASKVDYETGGVTNRFTPEEILALFPELREIANVDSRLIRNMFSEDMRFAHYNLMAKEIEKEVAAGFPFQSCSWVRNVRQIAAARTRARILWQPRCSSRAPTLSALACACTRTRAMKRVSFFLAPSAEKCIRAGEMHSGRLTRRRGRAWILQTSSFRISARTIRERKAPRLQSSYSAKRSR